MQPLDEIDEEEIRRQGVAQARTLRKQAHAGGLRFEVYLPPDLADWVLDKIERGIFTDPSEAVFVMLGEQRDLEPYTDLREEALRRSLQTAADDPRPRISQEEMKVWLQRLIDTPRHDPAIWRKPTQ